MIRRTLQPFMAVLFLLAVMPSDRARGGELDVVATTNVENSKAFVKACLLEIAAQTDTALHSLSPVDASGGKAKDGAARYRLLIDHKGTVSVGNTLTVRSKFGIKEVTVKEGNKEVVRKVIDKTNYTSDWYLPVKQKGTLTFTLLKWDDGAYKSLDMWTIPTVNREAIENGLAPVATLKQDGTKAGFFLTPPLPISDEQARDEGFAQCEPGPFEHAFASRWVKGKFDKLTPKGDDEVDFDVTVENKSPWPLSRVFVESTDKNASMSGFVEFKPAIAPGKSGKGKGSTFVAPVPKKAPGMRVTEAQFDPQK